MDVAQWAAIALLFFLEWTNWRATKAAGQLATIAARTSKAAGQLATIAARTPTGGTEE